MAIFEDMPCFNTLGVRLQGSRQECTAWFSFKYHHFQTSPIFVCQTQSLCSNVESYT